MADTGPDSEYGMEVKFAYLACVEQAWVSWDPNEKKATITPVYYPGVKLVAFHRDGRLSLLNQNETALYEKALEITNQAKQETSTPIELEAWLNRWLSINVTYQAEAEDNYSDHKLPREWTAYGAIMNGKANCQGFADAFYFLASLCDFNVRYQFGTAYDGGHVWNAIESDGQWYCIDTTWNNMDNSLADVSYAYFNYIENNIPDQQYYDFAKVVDTAAKTKQEFDYYSLNNCVFDTLQQASSYAISQKLKNGEKTVYLRVKQPNLATSDLISALKKPLTNYGYNLTVYAANRRLDTCFIVYWSALYQ